MAKKFDGKELLVWLQRKKIDLQTWCSIMGITSYIELIRASHNLGLIEPPEEYWRSRFPTMTNQTEGIVVVEIGDASDTPEIEASTEPPFQEPQKKKQRVKRVSEEVTETLALQGNSSTEKV